MALKLSTGLRDYFIATGSFRAALDSGEIHLYAGPEPLSVDSALAGANTLLCVIKTDVAAGLTFEAVPVGGTLTKKLSEIWQGPVLATGIATFYRYEKSGDTGVGSTTAIRVQGGIGIAGADMNLSNTSLVNGAIQRLEAFSVAFPES